MTRKRSDYNELIGWLKAQDSVEDIELTRRMLSHDEYGDLYVATIQHPAGIRLWDLHDEFDVDVVYSWHDPVFDVLRQGYRIQTE